MGRAEPALRDIPWLAEGFRVLEAGGVRLEDERQSLAMRIAYALDRISFIDIAWCGLFVRHCLTEIYPETRTPWAPMRARGWLRYGRPAAPQLGAVMVFWLHWPSSPFGHTGFYVGEDAEAFHVLGGNQRDAVRVQRVGRQRLLGSRWPLEAGEPPGLRREAPPEAAEPYGFGEEQDFAPGRVPLPRWCWRLAGRAPPV